MEELEAAIANIADLEEQLAKKDGDLRAISDRITKILVKTSYRYQWGDLPSFVTAPELGDMEALSVQAYRNDIRFRARIDEQTHLIISEIIDVFEL